MAQGGRTEESVRPPPRRHRGSRVLALAAVSGVAAVHVLTRVLPLRMSLTYDEATTVVRYLRPGPFAAYTEPYLPNDHVLFNLLTWPTVALLGDAEPVYRLWSVVPAVVAVAWASWWLARRRGVVAGVMLLVLATAARVLLLSTVQARGYGLALLAGVAMLVATVEILDGGRGRWLAVLCGAGLVGTWTFPLSGVVFAAHLAVILVAGGNRRTVLVAGVATGLACLVVLGPVLPAILADARGLAAVDTDLGGAGEEAGAGVSFTVGALRQLVPRVSRTTSEVAAAALLGAYLLAGAVGVATRPRRDAVAALVPIAALVAFHALSGVYFAPRFAVPVAVHGLLVVALGVQVLLADLPRRAAFRPLSAAAGAVAVGASAALLWAATLLAAEMAAVSLHNFRGAVAVAEQATATAPIVSDSPNTEGLEYYAERPVEHLETPALVARACGDAPPPVVVQRLPATTWPTCLRDHGASVVAIRQGFSDGILNVYLLEVPPPPVASSGQGTSGDR